MNEIKVFENPAFGSVRTIEIEGEPWFVGKDIAAALGYTDTNKAVAMHVDEDDKLNDKTASSLGQRGGWLINESGLYSLILSSKLPTAKDFKRWVTHDVIPSIRKTGGYIAGQDEISDADLMARALLVAQKQIELRDKRIEAMRPKELFADSVCASENSILIGELAKLLRQNGVNIGQNRLFEWLRQNGYLIKIGGQRWNTPTQRAMEMGIFKVKESTMHHSDGHVSLNFTTMVTGKGQIYFTNLLLSGKAKM